MEPTLSTAAELAAASPWKLTFGSPAAALRPYLSRYCGYTDPRAATPEQRQLPSGLVPMIVNLGPALVVRHPAGVASVVGQGCGFVGGMHDTYALTQATGMQQGIQVDFTPLGAYLFLGRPMHELTNRVIAFDDLFGPYGGRLIARLAETREWTARFALLDAWIGRRVAAARPVSAVVAYAWQEMAASYGCCEIAALADTYGCSQKHLIVRFREEIGLPPKRTARILRFDRAIRMLQRGRLESWAALAADCGYYDQAHLIQDFRRFSGSTPAGYLREREAGRILPLILPEELD